MLRVSSSSAILTSIRSDALPTSQRRQEHISESRHVN
eukprot:COSAG05_NODE_7403_length_816_cov_1.075314_1_plen_36_part_10